MSTQPDLSEHGRATLADVERFASHVYVVTGNHCWLWNAAKDKKGYGVYRLGCGMTFAHRASYYLFVGPIPKGMLVCHTCDTPLCVRPEHLFLGTQADNMADKKTKGRNLVGSKHQNSQLTESQVAEIRLLLARGTTTQKRIAELYGVSQSLVCNIGRRKTWRHI